MKSRVAAEREYRKALKLNPDFAVAGLRLAVLLTQEKRDLEYARQLALRAEELEPADGLAAATAGYALYLSGHEQAGLREILDAAEQYRYNGKLWLLAAQVAAEAGYPGVAKQCLEAARRVLPRRPALPGGSAGTSTP